MPSKGRILHVEDNADNRHLVRRVLESEGYEVIEAANGAQALDTRDAPAALRAALRMLGAPDAVSAASDRDALLSAAVSWWRRDRPGIEA